LQTSPLPLGYRASALQYNETSQRFQPGNARTASRFPAPCSPAQQM